MPVAAGAFDGNRLMGDRSEGAGLVGERIFPAGADEPPWRQFRRMHHAFELLTWRRPERSSPSIGSLLWPSSQPIPQPLPEPARSEQAKGSSLAQGAKGGTGDDRRDVRDISRGRCQRLASPPEAREPRHCTTCELVNPLAFGHEGDRPRASSQGCLPAVRQQPASTHQETLIPKSAGHSTIEGWQAYAVQGRQNRSRVNGHASVEVREPRRIPAR